MNRAELFHEVKSWLESEKVTFLAEEDSFRSRLNGDNGLFDVRILCEEDPALLQLTCPVSVRIPAEKVSATGLMLHHINARLRIGAFHFHIKERVVDFRLALPIRPEAPLAEQFSQAIGTTVCTMDDHIRCLGLLACATPESEQAVVKLSAHPHAAGEISRILNRRLELN